MGLWTQPSEPGLAQGSGPKVQGPKPGDFPEIPRVRSAEGAGARTSDIIRRKGIHRTKWHISPAEHLARLRA